MDLKQKITQALRNKLNAEYIRLEEEDGISGFVVSEKFKGMPSIERQELLDEVLGKTLTRAEARQVVMIAGLTREEYETAGATIRIDEIREKAGGGLEIVLQGILSDAEYVRAALKHEKGVETSNPRPLSGTRGGLVSFQAKGTEANPLTKERALRVLKKTRFVEVMSTA